MSLTARIDEDIKAAMKAKETDKLGALRMLKSSLKYAVIEKGAASEAKGPKIVNIYCLAPVPDGQ